MTALIETRTLSGGAFSALFHRISEVLRRSAEWRVGYFYGQPWKDCRSV